MRDKRDNNNIKNNNSKKKKKYKLQNYGYMERQHFPVDDKGKKLPTIYRRQVYYIQSNNDSK